MVTNKVSGHAEVYYRVIAEVVYRGRDGELGCLLLGGCFGRNKIILVGLSVRLPFVFISFV